MTNVDRKKRGEFETKEFFITKIVSRTRNEKSVAG